ncbi:hypothetical protein C9374_014522 [Naegleria lovaniensis]|uniref:Uncharacterized protein n=1 Tax=Naegleria lovaniensis TaxID=51637 RepID=A0AA88GUH6_NAELO|nr:uncharacterized protein C9374_014522 [Naegleria lovaniensis]KAG2389122.1 hypothetical protein C9374_014522 [Naegleria lovaniensis]
MKSILSVSRKLSSRISSNSLIGTTNFVSSRCYSDLPEKLPTPPGIQISDAQKVRNRFIEHRANNLENYLGVVNLVPDVAHVHERHLVNDWIGPNVPKQLSLAGKDLYARVSPIIDFIRTVGWDAMSSHEIDFIEEWEACAKQYKNDAAQYTDADKAVLVPMMERASLLWSVALHAENLCSILSNLNNKYRNTYTYPDADKDLLLDITAEYVELRDKYWDDREIRDKLASSIFQRLTLVKQKIVLPELTLKFPKLFV